MWTFVYSISYNSALIMYTIIKSQELLPYNRNTPSFKIKFYEYMLNYQKYQNCKTINLLTHQQRWNWARIVNCKLRLVLWTGCTRIHQLFLLTRSCTNDALFTNWRIFFAKSNSQIWFFGINFSEQGIFFNK